MRKVYSLKKYCYYCNVIRAKYQIKKHLKNKNKKNITRNSLYRKNKLFEYQSLELNKKDISKIINDVIKLSKNPKDFVISFRKLVKFDLGLCLIFTSLLEYFSKTKEIRFYFKKYLMPKDKNIRNMFIQTGIFQILCNKSTPNQKGKICILKASINNQEELKQILLKISKKIVEFSLEKINISNNTYIKKHLNKIFDELLLNVKSHADTNELIYLAGEVQEDVIKFAILDQGIGFAGSIQKRSNFKDKILDTLKRHNGNYVKTIFESNTERHRNYSGENIRRGNGTKRLEESIKKCKGAKMQIVSRQDFYELYFDNKNITKYSSNSYEVEKHEAIGTLISFELPIKELLNGESK